MTGQSPGGVLVVAAMPDVTTIGAVREAEPYYPEYLAQTHTNPKKSHMLLPLCRQWGQVGRCEEGHWIAKELICNREWCWDSLCGGIDGSAHQRRKASWYPKARQLEKMGRFVITLPPEVRGDYRSKVALGKLGTSFKRMMQRHGFGRGLRRWHFFGEDHKDSTNGGEAPVFHPHMEVLVEAGHLTSGELDSIKASVGNILKVNIGRVNVHYQYAKAGDIGRKCHMVSYALRPTFTDWRWDEELAYEFIGFKNALPWGKWDGEPVWEVPVDSGREVPERELVAIENGYCPLDGSQITWGPDIRRLSELIEERPDDWGFVDGGYWVRRTRHERIG